MGSPLPAASQDSPILEGVVFAGDAMLGVGTVLLHRVGPDVSGEVDSTALEPGGEFQFRLPTTPDQNFEGDVYFASVEYQGVLYFGSAITSAEQLDSVYVVQVFESEEVPPEGVSLPLEVRTMFVEFAGDGWFATDLFAIDNRGDRTLVAQDDGVVWSYPLPPGASDPELGEGDMPPAAVSFEDGRVRVSAPLPPGERLLMIRYKLDNLAATIPAPGSTEVFEILVKEPFPPLRIEGLEPIGVVDLGGTPYRQYGASGLVDAMLTLVETEDQGPPPFEWFALLATMMLGIGALVAYMSPRRQVLAGPAGQGTSSREALILEVARIDDVLAGSGDSSAKSELLERRAVLLSLLRNSA